MDTFRQSGESLAGRYYTLRLHPVSVREWCAASGTTPEDALDKLLERGGFPEPFLAQDARDADRWRRQYLESANEILASVGKFYKRISDSGH